MTYLDAAFEILQKAGTLLSAKEITEQAIQRELIQLDGKAPDRTMSSALYVDFQKAGS